MVSKRKAKIAKEIMDAMHPDGPVNYSKDTRRGARLAKKITNSIVKKGPMWTTTTSGGKTTFINLSNIRKIKRAGLVKFGPAATPVAKGSKLLGGITPGAVALTVAEGVYKGTKRALDNPEFHRGKAGKGYIDLSVKKPGKYGVDY